MTDDLIQNPNDKIETDPKDLQLAFDGVMRSLLAKRLADKRKEPWRHQLETELQERVASLVATCRAKGLKTFKVAVTRPNGEKVVRRMDVAKIARTRSLN